MELQVSEFGEKSRLRALLDHFGKIEDPREPWRVAHPLPEVLLLVVCGTVADCDDYEGIAAWGEAHLPFLRRFLPYYHGVPGGRWLTLLMNRIDPGTFSACFTAWVRETWPERPDLVAIDGKTSRRSHDRGAGKAALHLVSAFATTGRLVLGQEAVEDKSSETTAIPVLLQRLAADGGLKGALVSIDAIACNATIATAIRDAGADYLLAVKANQPTLRAEIEELFATARGDTLESFSDVDKGHGRIEQRTVTVAREVDRLDGEHRIRGELRSPGVAAILSAHSRVEMRDRCRFDTRYYISSSALRAKAAARAVRGHWGIENRLPSCSTSPSRKTSPAYEKDMEPKTWPSSDTSPSTSSARNRTRKASSCGENSRDGMSTTSLQCSGSSRVNLDSLPWSPSGAASGSNMVFLLITRDGEAYPAPRASVSSVAIR